jgi:hypothetical protein
VRRRIERESERTDGEGDAPVYDLNGLTREERAIAEAEFER